MICIKKAAFTDIEILCKINVQTWKDAYINILPKEYLNKLSNCSRINHFKKELSNNSNFIFLMFLDKRCIGYINWNVNVCLAEIKELYIIKEFWMMGYGCELVKSTFNEIKKLGIGKFFLWVLYENINAINFYRSIGCVYSGDSKYIKIDNDNYTVIKMCGEIEDINLIAKMKG